MNLTCPPASPSPTSALRGLGHPPPRPRFGAHGIAIIAAEPDERARLTAAVGRAPGLRVVACHPSAVTLTASARHHGDHVVGDLVLYDLAQSIDPSALRRAVAMLRARLPSARVVGLVSPDDPHRVYQAILAGMDGCIFRPARLDDLTPLLEEIARGATPLCPAVAEQLMAMLRDAQQASKLSPTGVDPGQLTRREREVVRLLARGLAYKEVAAVLSIGLDTVRSHVRRLYKKLGIHTAAEAAAWAVRNGMAEGG